MPARYAWIIDRDHLAGDGHTDEGVLGPRGVAPELEAQLCERPLRGERFRIRDDDNELYYEGRIVGRFDGFEPLRDFGTPNAGATSIEYLRNGKWEIL